MTRPKNELDRDIRADVIAHTLSPLGWHLVAVANLDAAEHLVAENVKLRFEDPVRSLFAHAWELTLKACLRRQGCDAEQIRKDYGHDLPRLWDAISRNEFPALALVDGLQPFIERIGYYHRNRLYAYPLRGFRNDFSLTYIRATSSRLRLAPRVAIETFGSP